MSCAQSQKEKPQVTNFKQVIIKTGADQTKLYIPQLKGKTIAVVANQTSLIQKKSSYNPNVNTIHIVDYINNSKDITVKTVFAPEHGFRGKADAGEHVKNGIDAKTGIPIVSLYGKNKKPSQQQLKGIDIVIFDIQDVGARFYTYISTLHYVMEACAQANIPLIVLDRPNPNGHYIDGPVLDLKYKSFVGMHPVPVVYGMSIGEYAQMINGEQWLDNNLTCDLTVIPLKGYTHRSNYDLPIKPSPNLPNTKAINLYPSLCFFEGTSVSVGRGTNNQFQVIGSPYSQLPKHKFSFTPKPNEGAKHPKHNGKLCYGYDLRNFNTLNKLQLNWLIEFYDIHKASSKKETFFNPLFTKLVGSKILQEQIEAGVSENKIKESWNNDIASFKKIREKYLIYK